MTARGRIRTGLLLLLSVTMVAVTSQEASALIFGGEGNSPIADPGWPKGAAPIFNAKSRIAWWEGPPFGGGRWKAEYRGDAKALSAVFADFAKLDVKSKRVVLRDGIGRSFWLNKNDEPAKRVQAQMDWRFMVWRQDKWDFHLRSPVDMDPADVREAASGPPSEVEVYTGGNIRWPDVIVPKSLTIIDERLEAHGFTSADGLVLEGRVVDLRTGEPVRAKMRLGRFESQPNGEYRYPVIAEAEADGEGRWFLKHAPAHAHRVLIEAEGFVPRVAGHPRLADQPAWRSYDCELSRPASVTGRVTDDTGQPLADADVQITKIASPAGERYESPLDYSYKTGRDGRFRVDRLPIGRATVWSHRPGYRLLGLGQTISTPASDVELRMLKAARLLVTVDFTGTERTTGYTVEIERKGGEVPGQFSNQGTIDAKNQVSFELVPPGRYVVRGRPYPGSAAQQTTEITIELKGGQDTELTLSAAKLP